jgi:hypothetical protein
MPSLRQLALAFAFVSLTAHAQQSMTAEQVIAKMREAGGITPAATTVDTFKAGDPKPSSPASQPPSHPQWKSSAKP